MSLKKIVAIPLFRESKILGNVKVCELPEELTVLNRLGFRNPVYEQKPPKHLIVDFSACRHVDTSALGALVAVNKYLRDRGCRMVLVGMVHEEVVDNFHLCKLETLFDIAISEAEAYELLAPRRLARV